MIGDTVIRPSIRCDENGNQTDRGSDTFDYDHENRLIESVIDSVTSTSVYNGDGLRMSHTVGMTTTNYVWDVAAGLPLVLQDGENTYVYGLDLISATGSQGDQTYLLYDGLGSVTDVTDENGDVDALTFWKPLAGAAIIFVADVPAIGLHLLCVSDPSDTCLACVGAHAYDLFVVLPATYLGLCLISQHNIFGVPGLDSFCGSGKLSKGFGKVNPTKSGGPDGAGYE